MHARHHVFLLTQTIYFIIAVVIKPKEVKRSRVKVNQPWQLTIGWSCRGESNMDAPSTQQCAILASNIEPKKNIVWYTVRREGGGERRSTLRRKTRRQRETETDFDRVVTELQGVTGGGQRLRKDRWKSISGTICAECIGPRPFQGGNKLPRGIRLSFPFSSRFSIR